MPTCKVYLRSVRLWYQAVTTRGLTPIKGDKPCDTVLNLCHPSLMININTRNHEDDSCRIRNTYLATVVGGVRARDIVPTTYPRRWLCFQLGVHSTSAVSAKHDSRRRIYEPGINPHNLAQLRNIAPLVVRSRSAVAKHERYTQTQTLLDCPTFHFIHAGCWDSHECTTCISQIKLYKQELQIHIHSYTSIKFYKTRPVGW